jgi:alpha-maltose-1-phosphate synthase
VNIGVVTKEWPPEIYGGAGVHVANLIPALAKVGVNPQVHCFGTNRDGAFAYQNQTKGLNPALAALEIDLQIANNLSNVALVHTHTWYANFAGHLAKKLYQVPHLLTAHSLEPDRPWKEAQLGGGYRISSYLERAGYESADGIIAVSNGTKKDILRAYPFVDPAKISVIYNGIDTNIYFPQTSQAVLDKYRIDTPYALFVGRITRQKGLAHLLAAWEKVPKEFGLVLAASSPDEPEIAAQVESAIAKLQAERSNVIWIKEMLSRNELINLYSSAALFVCPSIYEPLGIVNLEAMACQVAVLGSKVGGIPEVVADGETGELVELHEDEKIFQNNLAQSITRLMSNPDLLAKYGAAGRKRAKEHFAWEAIAQQTRALYQSVIDNFN